MTASLPREIMIRTRFLRFAALSSGPSDSAPVIALHGWLDNAASFEPVAAHLPELHLVAVDLAGHGRSDRRPAGVPYHLVDFVSDVIAVADGLGWERFDLLAHSLGAGIATLVAGTVPERVRRLALIEGLGPWSGAAAATPDRLAEAIGQLLYKRRTRGPSYVNLEAAARARQQVGDLSGEAALILARRGTQTVGGRVRWCTDPRLTYRSPTYLTEEQVLAFLPRIRAPTLLIRGEAGLASPRQNWEDRIRRVPNLTLAVLPGRHHLHMEEPESVARLLREFFAEPA